MHDRQHFRLYNGTGHPIDCMGDRLDVDRSFPEAIRADTTKRKIGSVAIRTAAAVAEVPVYEIEVDGSVKNEAAVRARLEAIQRKAEHDKIPAAVAMSPLGAAAVMETFGQFDNVTYVYPADVLRDNGRIIKAQRFDIPPGSNRAHGINHARVQQRREEILGSETPWQIVSHLPDAPTLSLPNKARIRFVLAKQVIQPSYDDRSTVGYTEPPYNTPIVQPELEAVKHTDRILPHQLAVVHSRNFAPYGQLPSNKRPRNAEEVLAQMMMLHSSDNNRDHRGFQTGFDSFGVYSADTFDMLTERL